MSNVDTAQEGMRAREISTGAEQEQERASAIPAEATFGGSTADPNAETAESTSPTSGSEAKPTSDS